MAIVGCGCDGGLDESPKIVGDGCASAGYGSQREARIDAVLGGLRTEICTDLTSTPLPDV